MILSLGCEYELPVTMARVKMIHAWVKVSKNTYDTCYSNHVKIPFSDVIAPPFNIY